MYQVFPSFIIYHSKLFSHFNKITLIRCICVHEGPDNCMLFFCHCFSVVEVFTNEGLHLHVASNDNKKVKTESLSVF